MPEAEEIVSYNIPGFKLNGKGLCSFAGWKNHVSLYPIPHSGTEAFKKEISPFIAGKGTIQFPIGEPIPYALVREFVKFAIQDNERRRKY